MFEEYDPSPLHCGSEIHGVIIEGIIFEFISDLHVRDVDKIFNRRDYQFTGGFRRIH